MNQETLKILSDADDSVAWEAPEHFNWHQSIAQVRALKPQLEEVVGYSLELDDEVQDASYFAQLYLLCDSEQTISPAMLLDIYFSNFGRLFTIYCDCSTDLFPEEIVAKVREIIERNGFVYVDSSELDEPYTGVHESFRESDCAGKAEYTWAIRFFNYL